MGRFDDAARALDELGSPRGDAERARMGIAAARVALGRGDNAAAIAELEAVETIARAGGRRRAWQAARARAHLRAGQYAAATALAQDVVGGAPEDSLAADALSVRGVALAFTGEDTQARAALERAVRVARATRRAPRRGGRARLARHRAPARRAHRGRARGVRGVARRRRARARRVRPSPPRA